MDEKVKDLLDRLSLNLVALRMYEQERHEQLNAEYENLIKLAQRIRRLLKGEPEEPDPIEL
jgi:hypothetical protein